MRDIQGFRAGHYLPPAPCGPSIANQIFMSTHGPENAEFEIRKAYNVVVESSIPFLWENRPIVGVNPAEVTEMYKTAYQAYRQNDLLSAERWARASKHLARAYWCEAKIAYVEAHNTDLPFLEGATAEVFNLHEKSDTTEDLLNSVAEHIPPGLDKMPAAMMHYLSRAREHLTFLEKPEYKHELLRAERIKAAHEYGRVLEIMDLAYEAENAHRKSAA
jgi:hypothetical protein